MSKKLILLVSGEMQSGKDTLASIFTTFQENNVRMAYADELKEIAKNIFNWDGIKDYKGRILLQRIGTECGRFYNKDIWVNKVIDKIKNDKSKNYIITDVRFKNEYNRMVEFASFNNYDLISVRVIRSKSIKEKFFNLFKKSTWHKSEKEFKKIPYDIIIFNNSNINDYLLKCNFLVYDIMNNREQFLKHKEIIDNIPNKEDYTKIY